jgi:hypothetical protein
MSSDTEKATKAFGTETKIMQVKELDPETESIIENKRKAMDIDSKMKNFAEILTSLDSLDTKKKILWREIYENACTDRLNAYIMFTDVYMKLGEDSKEHITLGPMIAKYIERMNKANDQLIKLADLIAKEEAAASSFDPNDLYSKF